MDSSTARESRGFSGWKPLGWFLLLLSGCRSAPAKVVLPAEVLPPACQERVLPVSWTPASEAATADPMASETASVPEVTSFTVASAIDYGLRNNPRLRQAAAHVEATRAGETIAFAPFLPDFGTSYRYSGFNLPFFPAAPLCRRL